MNSMIVDWIHDSSAFPSLCSPVLSDGSHTSSKRVPPAPRGQGEIDRSALPAQADFNIRRGGYKHPSLAHTNGLYRIDTNVISIDSTIDTAI